MFSTNVTTRLLKYKSLQNLSFVKSPKKHLPRAQLSHYTRETKETQFCRLRRKKLNQRHHRDDHRLNLVIGVYEITHTAPLLRGIRFAFMSKHYMKSSHSCNICLPYIYVSIKSITNYLLLRMNQLDLALCERDTKYVTHVPLKSCKQMKTQRIPRKIKELTNQLCFGYLG